MGGGEEVVANTERDTRIVEMQFDAKDFDKGIRQSQKTLNDFKKDLDFEDASKQMESFNKEGNGLMGMFSSMAKDINKLTKEFAGVGGISTYIAKKIKSAWEGALNSVERFAKSLTSDQIKAGMQKFEDLQQSVQTIKSATGESEEQVYKVLRRLNEYTDMTSYSFSDMAKNIGKFTSVGIPLEQAEKQMEGIANWAARSGGDINEASRAMYNLSQAMGVGALTRIDWKSIENAGMATKEFKNQLIQAGLAVGTLVKKGDKIFTASKFGKQVEVTYQNMSETLSKRWADTETMQKAFMAYYYEDLYYEGKIASAIETSREQRDEIRASLNAKSKKDAKMDYSEWIKLEGEWADKWREDGKDVGESREAARKALLDAAVEQKKLVKETNAEGYEVYKTIKKNGKQIEITTDNLEDFFERGLMDESLITVAFNLDADPLIEMTEKQRKALTDSLGDDNVILKKDWDETMSEAGLATEEVMQASMDAAVKAGTLVREENKKTGEVTYKTAKKLGKQMVVTTDNFADTLKMKWFNEEVADTVGKFTDIGKASYEAAQRCTNLKQVLGALTDMLSTGWMNTYTLIFGELTESMGLFTAICNKASDILSKFVSLRNGILEKWGANGGRNSLWGALVGESDGLEGDTLFAGAYGLLDAMTDISDAIYEAFWDFVGRFISDDNKAIFDKDREGVGMEFLALKLQQITENLRDFTTKIKDFLFTADAGETETRFDRIKHVVESVFSVVTLITQVIKGVGTFVGEILKQLYPTFHALELLVDYVLRLFTGSVVKGAKENAIGNFFKNLAERLKPLTTIVNAVVVTLVKIIAYVINFIQQTGLVKVVLGVVQIALGHVAKAIGALIQSGFLQTILGFIVSAVQKIPALISKIQTFFATISEGLKNNKKLQLFIDSFKTAFSAGNLKAVLNNIKSWVKKLFTSIPALFSGEGGIGGLFKRILDGFLGLFTGSSSGDEAKPVQEAVTEAIAQPIVALGKDDTISKAIDEAKPGIFAQLKGKLKEIWDNVAGFFDTIANSDAIQKIKGFFSGTTFKDLKEILKWLSIFKMGTGIGQMGKGLKSMGKGVKVLGKNLKNLNLKGLLSFNLSDLFNTNIADSFNTKNNNFGKIGSSILQIAAAIGILVWSAKELAAMKPDEMKQAGIALAALLTGLLTASVIAKKFSGNGGALLGIAAALWLIIMPMKALMAIPWKTGDGLGGGLLEMIFKLGLLMTVVIGIAKLAGKIEMKGLVGMAVAINLLMIPLKSLSKMPGFFDDKGKFDKDSPLLQGLAALSGLMLAFGGAARLAGKGTKGMFAMAAAITLLIIPVKMFAKMKLTELTQGLGALATIMIGIGVLAMTIDQKELGKLGGMVGAITALAAVGWLIGHTLDWKQALVGFGPIILMLGSMALMFHMASKLDVDQLNALKNIFTVFSVLIGVIAASIITLTIWEVPLTTIVAFFVGIIGILAAAGAMVQMAEKTDVKAIGRLALILGIFSLTIVTIAASLGVIAYFKISWDTILFFIVGLGAVLLAVGGMVKLAEKTDYKAVSRLAIILGVFSVTILSIAASLALIAYFKVDWVTIAAFVGGLSIMLGMVGGVVKMAKNTNYKTVSRLAIILGVLSVTILAVAASLVIVKKYDVDWKLIGVFMAGILGLMVGLSILLPKLKAIGNLGVKELLIAVVAIVAVIVAIMGAISLMMPVLLGSVGSSLKKLSARLSLAGGLFNDFFAEIDKISEESVQHATKVFDGIKDLVVKFTGFGDHSDDIQSVLTQLENLGLGLDLFFLNDDKLPDPETAMSFKILNKFVEMGPSLAGFNVGNLPQQIYYLGVGLGLFNAATKDITTAEPLALGLMQGIFGQADNIEKFSKLPLDTFSGQMSTLGGAMSLYAAGAKEVTGIDADTDAPDIEQAIGILKSVSGALSGEDGTGKFEIPSDLPDKDSIGVFAAQLGALGLAMASFSEGAKGMDSSGTQKALDAIVLLATLGRYLTPDNLAVTGAFDDVGVHAGEGSGTLGQFALDIGALGTALGEFSSLTSNAVFDKGLGALDHFQELNQKLTKSNLQFVNAFNDADIHDTVLSTFATDIGHLGRALKSFATNVTMDDGTQADFNYAMRALNFMTSMSTRLSKIKIGTSLYTLIHGTDYTLSDIADDMTLLGDGLAKISSSVSSAGEEGEKFDYDTLMQALTAVDKLVSIVNAVNSVQTTGQSLNVGEALSELATIFDVMSTGSNEIGGDLARNMGFSGSLIHQIAVMAKDINDAFAEAGVIDTAALEGFSNIASGLKDLMTIDPHLNFEYPGQMIAMGIKTGIQNGESEVVQAAIDVVQAAIDAANETADVGSPSKVFAEMGGFFDAGLVKGILGSKDDVEGASSDMATAAIEQAGLIMAAVSQALADNVDLQPTITPVLDLSNITAAGSTLNSIFDGYALNLTNALNKAVAATSSTGPTEVIVQNPTDLTPVETAMATLQTEIVNLQTAISNIRIVLNNGAVAGGVVDDIDQMLGRRGMYDARRN